MKKIVVGKSKGIAEVIDEVLGEEDKDIVLVIPKGSALSKSVSNFKLLKREMDSAGRTIAVESVDDTVLAFAKDAGVPSTHPLWQGVKGGMSDIVKTTEPKKPARSAKEEVDLEDEMEEEPEPEEEEQPAETKTTASNIFAAAKSQPVEETKEEEEEDSDDDEDSSEDEGPGGWEPKISRRGLYIGLGIAAVAVIAGFYIVTAFFNHADITIDFKKVPWSVGSDFTADKTVSAIASGTNVIPAQVFTDDKNITQTFPASSSSTVSEKAHATITVYNNYNTQPQELVATTRFLTPDGKLFRLVSNVTVPGGKMVGGQLQPGTVDAQVAADQAGPAYNIGPIDHLSIPGFANTPRATGFYAVMTGQASGGFVGHKAVPTTADIANAKTKTTQALQASLQGGFSGNYPNNFKILDGATSIQVTKLTVNTSTDANGNFSVFGEATLQAIGFDEVALKNYLLALAQKQLDSSVFSDINLDYSNVHANFGKGQISFTLNGQGSLEPAFNPDQWKSGVAGKSISDARGAIAALPNLADGKISVWPFWLWSIPSNPSKINVTAN